MCKTIIKNCSLSISKALGQEIHLHCPPDARKRSYFDAVIQPAYDRPSIHDGRHQWHVVPIFKGETISRPYWVGIRMDFVIDGIAPTVNQVSMLVLRNDGSGFTDFSPAFLFRVEWMADTDNKRHAQPHWHIYGQPFADGKESDNDYFAKIHFAMASQWHNGNLGESGHYCHLDNSAQISSWFEGSIKYIKTQLEHLDSKMPPKAVAIAGQIEDEVKDFMPK